jgi:hypothetical protein
MSVVSQFPALGSAVAKVDGDARTASRPRTLKAGIVAFIDRHSTLPCIVRNVSATGARLRVEGSVKAPDTFELIIELDGLEVDCQVVWRKTPDVGVRFLSEPRIVAAKRRQVVNPLAPSQAPSLRRKPRTH